MKAILGKKLGMTTIYDAEKGALNVTMVECVPNIVSLLRRSEKDGYSAVQLEMPVTEKRTLKREFRTEKIEGMKEGDKVTVESFSVGDKVKVSGITKAKGFQGVMKRHGFHGSPATHGHRHDHRAPGSIGSAFPEHVFKGKKMAGRTGGGQMTVGTVVIVFVDKEKNLLAVKGAVPGVSGRSVAIFGS